MKAHVALTFFQMCGIPISKISNLTLTLTELHSKYKGLQRCYRINEDLQYICQSIYVKRNLSKTVVGNNFHDIFEDIKTLKHNNHQKHCNLNVLISN